MQYQIKCMIFVFFLTLGTDSYCMLSPANANRIKNLTVLIAVTGMLSGINSYCLTRSSAQYFGAWEGHTFCTAVADSPSERLAIYGPIEGVLAIAATAILCKVRNIVRQNGAPA